MFFIVFHAKSQTHRNNTVGNNFEISDIKKFTEIYRSDNFYDAKTALKKIKNNEFEHLSADNYFPGFADKYYWLVINIRNTSKSNKDLILQINNPNIDTIYFYEIYEPDSIALSGESGDAVPFSKRKFISECPVFQINIETNKEKAYLLMLRKRKLIKFPAKLYDIKRFQQHNRKKMLIYSFYFGSVLLIFIFSMITGISTKNKIPIAYGIYVFWFALYLFIDTGYAFEFLYPEAAWLNSSVKVPVSILGIIAFLYFSNLFIDTKKYNKLLPKIFNVFYITWLAFYFITLPFVYSFSGKYNFIILLKIQYAIIIFAVILMIITFVTIYKHNKKACNLYLLAMGVFTAGIILYFTPQLGFLKFGITNYHPLLFASSGEIFIFSIAVFFKIKNISEEKNRLALLTAQQEKDILTAYLKGSEKTQAKISNELHDNIGSRLALIKNIILSGVKDKKELSRDVGELYDDVRELSHRLSYNKFFMLGCSNTIKGYLKDINDNTKLSIQTKLYCNIDNSLDNEFGLQIFRIIQEALQNCIKHAGKATVYVQIILYENEVSLTIEDDGKGFDTTNESLMNGNGITNMLMRTKLLNGMFEISSEPGKGTFIAVTIPVNHKSGFRLYPL